MKDITYLQRDFMNDNGKLLILSVTKQCNLACKYCKTGKEFTYDRLSFPSTQIHFPKEKFSLIKDVCLKNNVKEVTLTGGEPIEYPFLVDLMDFFQQNKIRFSLHTNGTSRNWDKVLNYFKDHFLFPDIHISVELFEPLQKEVRGANIPVGLIEKLVDIGCNIELKVTIHQKILPYLSEISSSLDSFIGMGVKSMRIQPVFFPIGIASSLRLNKNSVEMFKKFLELKKEAKYSNFIRNSNESLLLTIEMLSADDISKVKKPTCVAKDKVIFMQPDGKQVNCLQLWGKKDCNKEFDLICCGFVA